ncbi:MAG: DUF5723 family protein [Gemmatimonadetes bacterium]|nr:DUF5723 family protein [Gemmatimonadota bacterium]
MKTTNRVRVSVGAVALAVLGGLFLAAPVAAQLPSVSAATLGTGGNNTATVRGFGAIGANPAGLGMPGPGFSLALAPIQALSGLDPISLTDLGNAGGKLLSDATKADWLSRVTQSGGQSGTAAVGLSAVSLNVGRIGFQLSTIASADVDMEPSIVELALYGNAGRTGTPVDLALGGSSGDGFAVTTAGVSVGIPLHAQTGTMALGATLKYSMGQALAVVRDQGGSVQSDPVAVRVSLPVVSVDPDSFKINNGSGVGLDVGFQMKRGRTAFGAAVMNLFNTFSWNTDRLVYRAGTVELQQGTDSTSFDKQAYGSAPSELRSAVDGMTFKPTVSVGAAYDVWPDLTVSADARTRFGDGMSIDPKTHVGAGAEYRGFGFVHVRAGLAVITRGYQAGGGLSLILGPVDLSAAAAFQGGQVGQATLVQLTLSWGGY